MRPEPRWTSSDVARAVAYMASLPPDANVLTMTVMAAGMPFVGRGWPYGLRLAAKLLACTSRARRLR